MLAQALLAALRERLPGYHAVTPDTLQRRFLETSGTIINHGDTITVRLKRRAYSIRAAQSQPLRPDHRPLVGQPYPCGTISPEPCAEPVAHKSALDVAQRLRHPPVARRRR